MAINTLFNLKVILLVLFALCALFLTNTQATSSLSELNHQCEKKFWFKDLKDFKKSTKSKCLKEKSYNYEKKHRKHNVCKNNSHDKKLLLSKWEEFSDCRCGSALVKLSNFKESKIFVCFQIASFNKASGEFVGELTTFKKKSEHNYDIAVRFPKKVRIYDQKSKYNDFYRLKEDKHPSHNGKFLVEKILITGRIPKYHSMNRITIDEISPDEFILLLNNGRVRSLKKDREFVVIPLSKFILSENFLTKEYKYEYNKNKDQDKDQDKDKYKDKYKEKKKKPSCPPPENQTPPANQPPPPPPAEPAAEPPTTTEPPAQPSAQPSAEPSAEPQEEPPSTSPSDDSGTPGGTGSGSPSGYGSGYGGSTPGGPQAVTGPEDSTSTSTTDPTPSNAASQEGQESTNSAKKTSGGISSGAIGSIVFGAIIAVGAAFVGYNTYERVRWRRQYRRRQEAAAQPNTSLANVPDYSGYGRAY